QAEDGIRDKLVTGVQTCALPISWCSKDAAVLEAATGIWQSPNRVLVAIATAEASITYLYGSWFPPAFVSSHFASRLATCHADLRSEERRVGKEWRSGGVASDESK